MWLMNFSGTKYPFPYFRKPMKIVAAIQRIMLGLIFLASGISHFIRKTLPKEAEEAAELVLLPRLKAIGKQKL